MRNQAIGFLDSGVGGLSVVKEVMKKLPNENLLFIGDTARNPYGNRTKEEVIQYSQELSNFLIKKNIKMLVIACNTATAAALDILKVELDIPVIGVIEPGSYSAVKNSNNNNIGIIGTVRTIESSEYSKIMKSLNPLVKTYPLAIPEFVELVEKNDLTSENTQKIVKNELSPFKGTEIDSLVLACTHFPFLADTIRNYLGDTIELIDPAIATAELIKEELMEKKELNQDYRSATEIIFYTTGEVSAFENIAHQWIPKGQFKAKHVSLEELK